MDNNFDDLLIIRANQTKPKVVELFDRIQKDKKLMEIFSKNPWSVLESIGELPKGYGISQSNRLLFSLLSNTQFLTWAKNYRKELIQELGNEPGLEELRTEKIYLDIMNAWAKFADKELMFSLFGDYNILENTIRERQPGGINIPGCVFLILWVAVVVLPVVVVIVEPAMTKRFMGRDELAQIVDAVSVKLEERAKELRKNKILSDPEARIGTSSI